MTNKEQILVFIHIIQHSLLLLMARRPSPRSPEFLLERLARKFNEVGSRLQRLEELEVTLAPSPPGWRSATGKHVVLHVGQRKNDATRWGQTGGRTATLVFPRNEVDFSRGNITDNDRVAYHVPCMVAILVLVFAVWRTRWSHRYGEAAYHQYSASETSVPACGVN